MIISEKQIMQLIAIAQCSAQRLMDQEHNELSREIGTLIDAIDNQQSDELKEVK